MQWKWSAELPSWKNLLSDFIEGGYAQLNSRVMERRFRRQQAPASDGLMAPSCKKIRTVDRSRIEWQLQPLTAVRCELVGDSKLIINWLRGLWIVNFRRYDARVRLLQQRLEKLSQACLIAPPTDEADIFRHIFRELNSEADAKANFGRIHGAGSWHSNHVTKYKFLRVFFDGSCKDELCGSGVVAYGTDDPGENDQSWHQLAWMAYPVNGPSITAAELEAAAGALAMLETLVLGGDLCSFFGNWTAWQY